METYDLENESGEMNSGNLMINYFAFGLSRGIFRIKSFSGQQTLFFLPTDPDPIGFPATNENPATFQFHSRCF